MLRNDQVGNRLTSLGATFTYNSSNEITTQAGATFTWDNNGNPATRVAAATSTWTWDFENRLLQTVSPNDMPSTVNYKYDPFGRRIYKSSPVGTTLYVYDGDNIIEELDADGNSVARYTQGLGIDEPLAMLRSSATSFYQADGLGTITSLSDSSGALAATYTYDSFGKKLTATGTLTNPFRFTARELDPELDWYYYRARYYARSLGRFVSEDPARINGDIDFYRYSYNEPTKFVDPMGLAACASGRCADCPDGVWESGVAVGEGTVGFGPVAGGGLVFSGIFICRSNPSFNVPWTTGCGQGFAGKKIPPAKGQVPRAPAASKAGKGKGFGFDMGFGGAFIRCSGIKCTEGLGGPEKGKFLQIGPGFYFRESPSSGQGTCSGVGVEVGGGLYVGGFGCYTWLGGSLAPK